MSVNGSFTGLIGMYTECVTRLGDRPAKRPRLSSTSTPSSRPPPPQPHQQYHRHHSQIRKTSQSSGFVSLRDLELHDSASSCSGSSIAALSPAGSSFESEEPDVLSGSDFLPEAFPELFPLIHSASSALSALPSPYPPPFPPSYSQSRRRVSSSGSAGSFGSASAYAVHKPHRPLKLYSKRTASAHITREELERAFLVFPTDRAVERLGQAGEESELERALMAAVNGTGLP